MANLSSAIALLDVTHKALFCRWENTQATWNDLVRWDFEKQYWTPLEAQIQATQRELERLAQIIAQAQRSVR
jgi:hypothetical protein